MFLIQKDNAEDLFLEGLALCKRGRLVAPRRTTTLEAFDSVAFELTNPLNNLITNPYRKLNYTFGLMESVHMWNGINDVAAISFYNKEMAKFSDDGETFFGAYGPRFASQLPHVLSSLNKDRDSRQAVVSLWRPSPPQTKDTPCTILLHFMIRNFLLELTVYMRSNDIWLGFPYDLTNFTRIQGAVAAELGVGLGVYRHIVGSLHLYAGDVYKVEWATKYPGHKGAFMPVIRKGDLVTLDSLSRQFVHGIFRDNNIENPFLKTHADLLREFTCKKLNRSYVPVYPEPYKTLMEESKRVAGYFKDNPKQG